MSLMWFCLYMAARDLPTIPPLSGAAVAPQSMESASASVVNPFGLSSRPCHVLFHRDEAIGVDRNRIDASLDQKAGEIRVVTGRLAADPDLRPALCAA